MSLSPGRRLGPYEILSPLGAGGMGEVYRARDTKLGREVAVKVLPAELALDPERRARFEHEARAASALNHPNIVAVHDIGSTDSGLYIAMELVEGRTLRELLASGPVPTRKLLDISVQVADGIAKAHAAGIVHRDLKPANLMVSTDGYAKVLDFGLSKLAPSETAGISQLPTRADPGTRPGAVLGTVGYMSPEQARGEPVDFRSDQFSFGAILYEMATGRRAFQRNTGAETLAAIIREEPEPVAKLNPAAPPPLRWIVERCLAKEPDERYASTKDLARDLHSIRDHLSETTQSGAALAVAPSRTRRQRGLALVAAGVVLGLALGFLAARAARVAPGASGAKAPAAGAAPAFQRLTFRRGSVSDARFAPDGQTIVYSARFEGKPAEIFSTRPESPESRSLGLPSAVLYAISSTGELAIGLTRLELGANTLARVPLSGGAPRELLEDVLDADWSPDGKHLAVVRRALGKDLIECPIGRPIYETGGRIESLRFSPGGDLLAFFEVRAGGPTLMVSDLAGKAKELSSGWWEGGGVAWSPQGDEVWFTGSRSGWAMALQAVTLIGQERTIEAIPGGLHLEDISRDGRVLFIHRNARSAILFRSSEDARERDLSWLDDSHAVDLSADGKTVVFSEVGDSAGATAAVYLRRTDGAPAVRLGDGVAGALSPDGKWVLALLRTSPPQLVLLPTGPGTPRTLETGGVTDFGGGIFLSARFRPEGREIVFSAAEPGHGRRTYLKSLDGREQRAITPEGSSGSLVSPDGRSLVAHDETKKTFFIYPLEGGDARPLPALAEGEVPFEWSGDGRSLLIRTARDVPTRVHRLDLATGRRELWKELSPPDPAGVYAIDRILVTRDLRSYAYSYHRFLEDLFLARGLR